MEDDDASILSDEQKCVKLKGFNKQIRIFTARKGYVTKMLDIERNNSNPMMETTQKLEEATDSLTERLQSLIKIEGKMLEFLPCPVPLCMHNLKPNSVKKRPDKPINRPAKLTASVSKNPKKDLTDFKLHLKTVKSSTDPAENVQNSFAVLNSANEDVEDVTLLHLKFARL
ncbi:hypothetical protein TNCT_559701 [Trichonephila clavata]|uniref:Uncharacterized protein n=1 Tax=Trichonephila clavata TaxID=2740835 RepID=A0A8X6HKG5_TRICU|nr:hypothetical protein TNCT_559701 [Trichonephila clavata]